MIHIISLNYTQSIKAFQFCLNSPKAWIYANINMYIILKIISEGFQTNTTVVMIIGVYISKGIICLS